LKSQIAQHDSKWEQKRAVKTARGSAEVPYLEREKAIHERLSHPLIVGFEEYRPATWNRSAEIVSEFVPNGSLANHLGPAAPSEQNGLSGGTRMAIIVAGIALAMRYLHSRGIIHRDLRPENIFLDWDWIVRIGDFSHSVCVEEEWNASTDEYPFLASKLSLDARYTAPECFDNHPTFESDVFSFGLILSEMLVGKPAFPRNSSPLALMNAIVHKKVRPAIPKFVLPDAAQLICDCLKHNPAKRPLFASVLIRLEAMKFGIAAGVRPEKVFRFVRAVEARETFMGIDPEE
jgi:serine/threonine protein kinase